MEEKIIFTPFNGPQVLLNMEEAKSKVKQVMPTTDLNEFEKLLSQGYLIGFNDNYFKLEKAP
ncbi:hypothetical protein MKA27_19750 [[Clostridium] innocuum]|uniref:hypothetical protein n=1 Tax=Clostridium innocuum TaxID=1522 RepID=UPI000D6C8AF7|nr:hypothetical protein [[Clostridium] innocuum]MCR0316634.1 hypothetical protein [[Clostridium] innocuum]MCR0371743.1 hypothetical protein [[Clostridium] innocuum]MCR0376025.1 hypothetical protein [[Clostridium] innocuum]MCR0561295.1 hypothetical protein [[Clostridium] innocuum]MCR0604381.1 hypothetical protein [[Clostridium] innocuum]